MSTISSPQLHALRAHIRAHVHASTHAPDANAQDAVARIQSVFDCTVRNGENQSAVLLAPADAPTQSVVAHALRGLQRHARPFLHVYLNGAILQSEIEAFKEIIAQLTQDDAITLPRLSYWKMYEYLKQVLADKARENVPVIVILDGLEKFASAGTSKQLLLYNLLDWLQTTDVQLGVLGITPDYNIVSHLEKRVRSRFSSLQVVLDRPSLPQVKHLMQQTLRLSSMDSASDLPQEYVETFDQNVREQLEAKEGPLHDMIALEYDIGRGQQFFLTLAAAASYQLSPEEPQLTLDHWKKAFQLLDQDHELASIRLVHDDALALLIGMRHLEKDQHAVYTLEMVYDKWRRFYDSREIEDQMPTRSEAHRALQHLLQLHLVRDAGDAFRLGHTASGEALSPEFRAVQLNMDPRRLDELIANGSVICTTTLREWAVNGV